MSALIGDFVIFEDVNVKIKSLNGMHNRAC